MVSAISMASGASSVGLVLVLCKADGISGFLPKYRKAGKYPVES